MEKIFNITNLTFTWCEVNRSYALRCVAGGLELKFFKILLEAIVHTSQVFDFLKALFVTNNGSYTNCVCKITIQFQPAILWFPKWLLYTKFWLWSHILLIYSYLAYSTLSQLGCYILLILNRNAWIEFDQ